LSWEFQITRAFYALDFHRVGLIRSKHQALTGARGPALPRPELQIRKSGNLCKAQARSFAVGKNASSRPSEEIPTADSRVEKVISSVDGFQILLME
jgi:hypothetical protein